jgi:hypothetical protein
VSVCFWHEPLIRYPVNNVAFFSNQLISRASRSAHQERLDGINIDCPFSSIVEVNNGDRLITCMLRRTYYAEGNVGLIA